MGLTQSCMASQTCNPLTADAATSVSGEQSQKYREELEQLIKSRMAPGERALPELKSSPTVSARYTFPWSESFFCELTSRTGELKIRRCEMAARLLTPLPSCRCNF